MVVLIAFCGYNWLLVQRLQGQVNDLNQRLASGSRLLKPNAGWLDRTDSRMRTAQRSLHDLQTQMAHLRAQADALWRQANHEALHRKRESSP